MKTLLFHPTQLPPKDYGGVERVVLWLAKGLLELGHEVWVGAYPGSRLPAGAKLLEVVPERSSALDLLEILPKGLDVVHFMAPPEAGAIERLPCATLLTVHGNGKGGEKFPKNSVFLSQDHARRHGATAFVHNGIDPSEYIFDPKLKTARYAFLSKTSWKVKNVRGALSICQRAGVPLDIAGGNRPIGVRLRAAVSPSARWIGPVAGAKKAALLARARGLVFPVLWPEPFGLVMAEALMSGTPVFASGIGSVPELVHSGVGAVLPPLGPSTEEQWMDALRSEPKPDQWERCRDWAMEKFHYLKMARSYAQLYQRVQGGEMIHRDYPKSLAE